MIKYTILIFVALMPFIIQDEGPYKDGTYCGISRAIYTNEPYYGHSYITVKDGKITDVQFFVRDSAKHEYFDEMYERHFAGNEEYVKQCRNDWKGVQSYPAKLLKRQDPDKVDAISGATWSYNLFKASAKKALSFAKRVK